MNEPKSIRQELELPLGSTRDAAGKKYKAVENDHPGCIGCDIQGVFPYCFSAWDILGECGAPFREDGKNIIFKEVTNADRSSAKIT